MIGTIHIQNGKTVKRFITIIISVLLFSSSLQRADGKEMINMDFNNADIVSVIKFISEITKKNFVVDDKVRGKVTIISPQKVSVKEAYHVFESILEVHGYTAVPAGKVIKIIPLAEAKQRGVEIVGTDDPGGRADRVVTRLIPLKFIGSDTLLPMIKPILSNTSFATSYSPANTLIVTDLESNVHKLLTIIGDLDVEGRVVLPVIEIVPLKYAYSKTLATEIQKVFEAKAESKKRGKSSKGRRKSYIKIISDDRTNSLILVALPEHIKDMKSILTKLDIESPPGKMMEIEIIPLDFANAKTIATEVERVFEAKVASPPGKGGKVQRPIKKNVVKVIPDERTNSIIVITKLEFIKEVKALIDKLDKESPPGKGKINVYNLKNANADELAKVLQTLTAKINRPSSAPGKKKVMELEEEVTITSNKATNSLIIVASPQDYEVIKEVIEQLDVRRPQVFVEAMIVELSTTNAESFGIEWRTTSDFSKDGIQGFGGTSFGGASGIGSVAVNPASAAAGSTGLVVGVVDGMIDYNGTKVMNLGGLMRALQQSGEANVLSTPNILTTDNEEAEIMVGENIPIKVGSTMSNSGLVTENIERRDIGLILRIKPQINESDYVRLNIYQEISGIVPKSADFQNITSKRSAKTTVVVKDGQTIVIGGLIQDTVTEGVNKVPFFGDIPILGWLFKYKTSEKKKVNLLIFISPHIIRSDEDIEKISAQKKSEMKSFNKITGKEGKGSEIKNHE